MSESLNDVSFDLDLDLDLDLGEALPRVEGQPSRESAAYNLYELAVPVQTLTNSPGCLPSTSTTTSAGTATPTAESHPPQRSLRRARSVRVDAWAVPASANWGRNRRVMRKVSRVSRSTDWALPF